MANEFIARKGLISLGDSQITGSLETTSNLNVGGQAKIYNRNFIIGTQVTASGFPGNFEFQAGPSTYSSQLVLRPTGNPGGYNSSYWGTIRWNPANEQGLTILAGNYKKNILFGRGNPSTASPQAFAKLNNDGLRLQSSYIQSIASAEERLHVVGNAKITGFVTASGNLITEANITASGHVSASTYYGDGSNLTGISSDPFPYTGDAVISGSLEVSNPQTSSQFIKIEYNQSDDYRTRLTVDGPRVGTWDGGGEIMLKRSINTPGDGGTLLLSGFGSTGNNTPHIQSSTSELVFADALVPNANGSYNLGLSSRKWGTLWGSNLDIKSTSTSSPTVTISGSNSLAGNYALKVTNTSGADILNVENDGNVGIGTDTPDETLQVTPSLLIGKKGFSAPVAGQLRVASPNTSYGELGFTSQYDNFVSGLRSYGVSNTTYARDLRFYVNSDQADSGNGDEAMRLDLDGNLGIGLEDPQTNLHVSGAVSASTYYGDGSNLTGITGISFNGSTANGLVTYGSATTANVEANLTFDGSTFELQGASNFNIQASAFNFNGVPTGTDNTVLVLNSSDNIVTDEIDSRVWGTSLIDSSGFTMEGGIDMDGQTISMNGGEITNGNDIGTARLLAGNGSAGSPSISFTNDTNTGIYLAGPDSMLLQAGGGTAELLINTSGVTVNNGTFAIPGISDVSASIAAASGGGGSAYHTWIGGRGQNTSQATYGTQWRGGMSGNALGGSFVVNADSTLLTVSSGTPSVGDTISANNYKIVTTLIHPAMAFTTIDWYGHFRAYNSACDGNEQHMEIWTLDDVNDLVGFGTTTLTFRGGNQWTYDGTSATIKPIITSGSISHTGTETTAFVVVSHVPTNPASSMQFVYKFDFTVT